MYLFMLDVDGILQGSDDFECFHAAVQSVLGFSIDREEVEFAKKTDIDVIEHLLDIHHLTKDRYRCIQQIKSVYLTNLRAYIVNNPHAFQAKKGVFEFIDAMQRQASISTAIVTKGWKEAAMLKLTAAGIHIDNLNLSSCSDAMTRGEIMALSAFRAKQDVGVPFLRRFYFADGEWNKLAAKTLGYEFIAVGHQTKYHIQIQNFSHYEAILGKLGLTVLLQESSV